MKKLLLLILLAGSAHAYAQISAGAGYDNKIGSIHNVMKDYLRFDISFRKPLNTDFNLLSGVTFQVINPYAKVLINSNDFATYYRKVNPEKRLAMSSYVQEKAFAFRYVTIPIALEFKVNTFTRVQYNLDNNFLVGTNKLESEYLVYGKKSISRYMNGHSFSLLLHQKSVGIRASVTYFPNTIRTDLNYGYAYMYEFNQALRESYFFRIGIWYDFAFKPIKKIL